MKPKLNRIKSVLAELDISQIELAKKIGKSYCTINAYCCNRKQPSLEQLVEIATALGVEPKDLLSNTFISKSI